MKKKDIILIGGGGHCKSCIDVIEHENKFNILGIIDVKSKVGDKILGYPIIGTDDDLDALAKKHDHFLITIGYIKTPEARISLFEKIKNLNKTLPIIVSPNAYVSKNSKIDEGSIIMNGAIINSATTIGKNTIINSNALIEHDVSIGNNCHISTSSTINGGCKVSDNVFIGSKSVLIQNIKIAKNTVIGAGSVIINDINSSGVYVGSPAKKLNQKKD